MGKRGHERFVASGSNHHMEIYAVLDENGEETKWETVVVSLQEAYRRVREKEPVIKRDFKPNTRFVCSISLGEAVMLDDDQIYVVRTITEYQQGTKVIGLSLHNDARPVTEAIKGHRPSSGTLKDKGLKKVYIDVLGRWSFSRD